MASPLDVINYEDDRPRGMTQGVDEGHKDVCEPLDALSGRKVLHGIASVRQKVCEFGECRGQDLVGTQWWWWWWWRTVVVVSERSGGREGGVGSTCSWPSSAVTRRRV